MSNETHQFTDEDFDWAKQDDGQYKAQTEKTRDVLVPEGRRPFRVRVMKPARLMGYLERYGLKDVAERVSGDANLADEGNASAEKSLEFIEDVLFPNIVKPAEIYYEEGETEQEGKHRTGFNFVDLTRGDLEVLIAVMADTPAEEAIEQVQNGEGAINVSNDSMPGFRDDQQDDYEGRFR